MNSSLDENNELSFSDKLKLYLIYLLKKFCIIILSCLFTIFIEKILFSILSYFLYFSLLAIILQIILHLILLRYLVLKVAFAGLSFFITRNIQYKRGKIQASFILKELSIIKSSFELLFDEIKPVEEIKHFYTLQRNIRNAIIIIKSYWETFHKMKAKFNRLTYEQNLFYEHIHNLKDSLDTSEIINFLNKIIKKLREENTSNINNLLDKDKNEIIRRKNEIKKLLYPNAFSCINCLINQLVDYIGEHYQSYSPRYISNYFSNLLFASLHQFDVELKSYFIYEQKTLITKDGKAKLDYIIINHNTGIKQKIKKLMIICGPNAEPYQIFTRNISLNTYLNKGIDILCWNYRGYGFSTGKANFDNLRQDIISIYEEIKKNYNYDKIGIHGVSLGGIPACHLAGNIKDVKLLVSDRNFGQIENIAKNCFLGNVLVFIYKLLFIPSSNNVENYLNGNGVKILLNDPKDEIVTEEGALKTMISEKICNEFIKIKNFDSEIIELNNIENKYTLEDTNDNINSIDNQIEIEDDEHNNLKDNINSNDISLKIKKKSSYDLIHQNSQTDEITKENNNNSSLLDILLSSDKNIFITSLIDISLFLKGEKDQEISDPDLLGFVMNNISEILKSFKSAGDSLYRINEVNNNKYNQTLFIENIFNNLIVWGTYDKLDDYGSVYYSTEFIEIMLDKNINQINTFLNSEIISKIKNTEIIKKINIYYNHLMTIRKRIKYIGIKRGKDFIYLKDGEKFENELIKLRGNLVSLSCGHNGQLSEEENIVFKYYLNKSELFIDDEKQNDDKNNEIENLDTSFSELTKSMDNN